MKAIIIAAALFASPAVADDFTISPPISSDSTPVLKLQSFVPNWTFMSVLAKDHNAVANDKFFIGRLPKKGEAVEMIYTGDNSDGSMNFQLRVR